MYVGWIVVVVAVDVGAMEMGSLAVVIGGGAVFVGIVGVGVS